MAGGMWKAVQNAVCRVCRALRVHNLACSPQIDIKATAFAMDTKSKRRWEYVCCFSGSDLPDRECALYSGPPLTDEDAENFKKVAFRFEGPPWSAAVTARVQACQQAGFTADCILPHGSYLMNCGYCKCLNVVPVSDRKVC
jgi:hypothetical protein